MSEKTDGGELVVKAGYVTVKKQVGAGMAYVDIAQGDVVPSDIGDEDRDRLLASGAIGKRDDDATYTVAARPVPGEVEPDEIPGDLVSWTVEAIMGWVGDDLARARVARHEELAKGDKARQTLLEKLDAVKAAQETEPPKVPEHLDDNIVPAAGGGVALPLDDPHADDGKTADERPAGDVTPLKAGDPAARTGRTRK